MANFDFLLDLDIFRKSLSEQQYVLRDFWNKAEKILSGSGVTLSPIPEKWTSLRHNYFSVLFIAVFFKLHIPLPRLRLYARLNHCLRSWVTSCDNLLDNELKELLLTDLPERAETFKSVHTLLVTDRIFFSFLLDHVRGGIITHSEMEQLLNLSLSSISSSGIEEAGEEDGVECFLPPEDILRSIHFAKTGQLFTSPLAAPASLGDIRNDRKADDMRNGLCHFGLACQILDDLSDLGMDLVSRKHNYLASLIVHGNDAHEKKLLSNIRNSEPEDRLKTDTLLYRRFPGATGFAQSESISHFNIALEHLNRGGLPFGKTGRHLFMKTLMLIFGYPDLLLNLRKS